VSAWGRALTCPRGACPPTRMGSAPTQRRDVPSRAVRAAAILPAMELTDRVLVVLGFVAGAMVGAMAMLAPLTATGTGVHGLGAKLLLFVGAVIGAVVGARVNEASARALAADRAAGRAA
jgi:hypothetical protein